MSQPLGRSVRLFLVDGKATGLITAEIMNWTGHVLAGQRADLPRFLARPEVGRTGIYLLYGPDPDATAAAKSDPAVDSPLFELSGKNGVQARAREIDGEFIVLKGSLMVADWKQDTSAATGYAKRHQELRENGKLVIAQDQALAMLTEDISFSSPSAAATIIFGQRRNGFINWKVQGTQINYGEWQNQKIQAVEIQEPLK